MEKGKPLCTVGGNLNWCIHYGKQYGDTWKIKIELMHDPAITLLGIYTKKNEKMN